jgi:excisionase family DNA binding protein
MPKLKVDVDIEDAYDAEEVAKILGVGIATVWRWLAKGKLPSFKLAGRTLVPASAVKALRDKRAD